MNLNDLFTEEKVRLDPKCWTGKKIGNPKTKMKGGTRVNNCVPAESVNEMDKSQTPPGRDGSNDSDAGKKEYTAKATTAKKVAKDAEKILNKELNKKQGVAEGLPQTLRKVVPGHAKREIDKKMDAGKFGKTDADKDANFQRYKKIQDKLKEQGVAEGSLEYNTPDPVVVVQDKNGKMLDKINLSIAAQKYKLGQPQNIKKQLAHQNYTTVGNYVIVSPMSGQPQDATTQGMTEGGAGSGRTGPMAWDTSSGRVGRVEKTSSGIRHHADPSRYGGTENEPESNRLDKSMINKMDNALGVKWDRESKRYFSPIKVDEEDVNAGEYDYEGDMAKDDLQTMIRAARRLNNMLDDNENMPEWVQSKINKAADYVDTAADYIESNKEQGDVEMEEGQSKSKEADYGDDYQAMVARVKKLAGLGPLKTVYDPARRVYRNVPTAQQPKNK